MLLQEIREVAAFVLNFIDDNIVLMGNSNLSTSPTMSLGKDRVTAIQLSSIVLVVLITAFLKTPLAQPVNIDVLALGVLCIAYFSVASVSVAIALRYFGRANSVSDSRDVQLDSNSYVLAFNAAALFVFAVTRDFLIFEFSADHAAPPAWPNMFAAILGAAVACGLLLYVNRGAANNQSGLKPGQKLFVAGLLTVTFVVYAVVITNWHGFVG